MYVIESLNAMGPFFCDIIDSSNCTYILCTLIQVFPASKLSKEGRTHFTKIMNLTSFISQKDKLTNSLLGLHSLLLPSFCPLENSHIFPIHVE